jgi:hypothetical protein
VRKSCDRRSDPPVVHRPGPAGALARARRGAGSTAAEIA